MAIYLPGTVDEEQIALDELTPREIVAELDKHVIGQKDAKRAVAIASAQSHAPAEADARACRRSHSQKHNHDRPHRRGQNRNRPPPWPSSPTRHFLKVEASKFTEVGYVGPRR